MFKYFGDKYLELVDELGKLSLSEAVELEINMNANIILLPELSFYIGAQDHMINTLRCVKELKKHPKDDKKQKEIFKKYNIKIIDDLPTEDKKQHYIG